MYDLNLTTFCIPAQTDMHAREITVGALLREVVAQQPFAEALVEICQDEASGRSWTFAELLKEAKRLALILSTRFNLWKRVVVCLPDNPEWVFMEYACTLAGLVLVTVNPAFQARELDYVLKQSEAVALF